MTRAWILTAGLLFVGGEEGEDLAFTFQMAVEDYRQGRVDAAEGAFLRYLGDRDPKVRWSAAFHLARLRRMQGDEEGYRASVARTPVEPGSSEEVLKALENLRIRASSGDDRVAGEIGLLWERLRPNPSLRAEAFQLLRFVDIRGRKALPLVGVERVSLGRSLALSAGWIEEGMDPRKEAEKIRDREVRVRKSLIASMVDQPVGRSITGERAGKRAVALVFLGALGSAEGELPDYLRAWAGRYPSGLAIVAVRVLPPGVVFESASYGLAIAYVSDWSNHVAYGAGRLPFVVLVGRRGRVRALAARGESPFEVEPTIALLLEEG